MIAPGVPITHALTIKRVDRGVSGGAATHTLTTVATAVQAHLHPLGETPEETVAGVRGARNWFCLLPRGTDVVAGDEVNDGTTYWRVDEVLAYAFGSAATTQVRLRESSTARS